MIVVAPPLPLSASASVNFGKQVIWLILRLRRLCLQVASLCSEAMSPLLRMLSLTVMATVHLGLVVCYCFTIHGTYEIANAQGPVYLYLVLAAVGVWADIDRQRKMPVVSFIVLLVICGAIDATMLILQGNTSSGIDISRIRFRGPGNELNVLVGINLVGKIITLVVAVCEVVKRRLSTNHHLESEKFKSEESLSSWKSQLPPSYSQIHLLESSFQSQAEHNNMSPVQALHVALENHPAAIQLTKLAYTSKHEDQ